MSLFRNKYKYFENARVYMFSYFKSSAVIVI